MSEERIKERCKREDIALKIVEGFLKKYCDKDTELYYSLETLLDLYQKEKEKNKELEKDNAELRRLKDKLSIATAIALDGKKISISKKSLNELNDMFSIEVEYRPFYDDYVFYAK